MGHSGWRAGLSLAGRRVLLGALLVALCLALAPPQAAAVEGSPPSQVAVLLILDNSGSMARSDPEGLRFSAAQLFVALLDAQDSVGAISFSTVSSPLTEGLVLIRGPSEVEALVERLQPSRPEGWTDFIAAFADAQKMLQGAHRAEQRTVILLLTDGEPEIGQPDPTYEDRAVALARELGVSIYGIALTAQALTPFLGRVVQASGGSLIPARESTDLLDAYLQALSQIKDRTWIGEGETPSPGVAALEIDPALAPYIQAASFVLAKAKTVNARLHAPDGHQVKAGEQGVSLDLRQDPRFMVVTVERPMGGRWSFRLEGSGKVQARAVLRSRLRVRVVRPRQFHEAGEPMAIGVQMHEESPDGKPISILGQASFSAIVTRPDGGQDSLDRFFDDGSNGDARAGDGEFTRSYPKTQQAGTYTITVQGRKGAIPVGCSARVEVVEFPRLVVEEPLEGRYDIRGQGVPLGVRLEGGLPARLDGGAAITAVVKAPSGERTEVQLVAEGEALTGAYLPREDGVYEVRFSAPGATYKGQPYQHEAQARFEARLIHALSVRLEPTDLGPVELATARQGVTLTLFVTSTSPKVEAVEMRLEGIPYVILEPCGPLSVPAGGELRCELRLRALPEATEGALAGQLAFRAREGLDLFGALQSLRLTLFTPRVIAVSQGIDLGAAGCGPWCGEAKLTLRSTSLRSEQISLSIRGGAGLAVEPAEVSLPPGESVVTLLITPTQPLTVGEHGACLALVGRPDLRIEPDCLPLRFRVEPFWLRCRRQVTLGGAGFAALVLVLLLVIRAVRTATRPPPVSGTLQHWPVDSPQQRAEVNLTALGRREVTIGRSPGCEVVIADRSLEEQHARLRAEKEEGEVVVVLQPMGKVRQGYQPLSGEITLMQGTSFIMGEREFRYLSD